ncbi:IclR family transcriptional regulator [Rhodococcus sp. NPDC056506]|uniref:IclR family transcriptional regulator n=1 Tax=Rhodococcus sp. NPDC056506 TaxID=3345844 RepID=UPI00366AB4B7
MTADRATAGPRSGKRIGEETHFSGQQPRAVQKALGMLEAVAHLGPGTTAKEIATFAGVPSATAYRMLNLLVAEGFLVRVPDLSGFALGRRTAELSHAASASGPAPTLHERVEDMRTHTRFGLHVASFAGGRLRFVDKDPDHEIIGIAALPKNLHANALGKVLLAHDERLLPGLDLRRVTEFTIGDFDILSEQLRSVRRQGFAFEDQECRLGRSALAVPVRDHADQVAGGLCVQGASGRVTEGDRELVGFLFDCARQLTGLL